MTTITPRPPKPTGLPNQPANCSPAQASDLAEWFCHYSVIELRKRQIIAEAQSVEARKALTEKKDVLRMEQAVKNIEFSLSVIEEALDRRVFQYEWEKPKGFLAMNPLAWTPAELKKCIYHTEAE